MKKTMKWGALCAQEIVYGKEKPSKVQTVAVESISNSRAEVVAYLGTQEGKVVRVLHVY